MFVRIKAILAAYETKTISYEKLLESLDERIRLADREPRPSRKQTHVGLPALEAP